ncbi:MAG: tetratricopeptide repeat protein [Rubricoccaceae bacterium]
MMPPSDDSSAELAPDASAQDPVPPTPETPSPARRPSLWAQALERRVPQILGLYVGGATSAVLFVEFLVKRYALSPYLVDALLMTVVLAVPAVAALAYWHGAPGAQRWTRKQQLVLGGNALVAVGALALAFWGKPLGATTETVEIETADGETVERTIARAAFRRRVVISDFSGDVALGRAAGYALATDLNQDLFVTAFTANSLRRSIRKAGFQTVTDAPAALLRDAASDLRVSRLVTGRVERTPQGFRIEADLTPVSGPNRPDTFTLEGPDFPRLLDELSSQVRANLDLPETHLEEADDRLIEDILTSSTDALIAWAGGLHAVGFQDDQQAALQGYLAATQADSTFALAHYFVGSTLLGLAQQAPALQALATAQRHRYRLLESQKFSLDATLAIYEQRPDDALASVREWAALYPDDPQALQMLSNLLAWRNDADGAIEVSRQLVTLDAANPTRRYDFADLLSDNERYDEALVEIDAYIAEEPDDARGHARRSSILRFQGDFERATEAIRQAMRLDPNDPRYALSLGDIQFYTGNWAEAEATFQRAADRAAESSDRSFALSRIAHIYDVQGRNRESAETLDRVWPILSTFVTDIQLLLSQLNEGYHYTKAGRTEVFERALQTALNRPEVLGSDAFRASVATATAHAYAQTGETDLVFQNAAIADSLLRAFGQDSALLTVGAFRGLGHANAENWTEAIEDLAPYIVENPTDFYRTTALAEVYLNAGNPEAARETAELTLRTFPAHPGAHLVLAKLTTRQPAEARRHLDAALSGWANADPDFEPAREARSLRRQLEG